METRPYTISDAYNKGEKGIQEYLQYFNIDKDKLEKAIWHDRQEKGGLHFLSGISISKLKLNKLTGELLADIKTKTVEIENDSIVFKRHNIIDKIAKKKSANLFTLDALNTFTMDPKLNEKYVKRFLKASFFPFGGSKTTFNEKELASKLENIRASIPAALAKELSDAEIIALNIYTNEDFFRLANAFLNDDVEKINELFDKAPLNEFKDDKNKALEECVLACLFATSALNKIKQDKIVYSFRGEKTLPYHLFESRQAAEQNNVTTDQKCFLSTNYNEPSIKFNNNLAGSSAILVVGCAGLDMRLFSNSTENRKNGEKECLYGPTHLSWLSLNEPADIPFYKLNNDDALFSNHLKLLTFFPNSIICYEDKLYYADASRQAIINISHTDVNNKKLPNDGAILEPQQFEELFHDVTDFKPTRTFYLAVPTKQSTSLLTNAKQPLSPGKSQATRTDRVYRRPGDLPPISSINIPPISIPNRLRLLPVEGPTQPNNVNNVGTPRSPRKK